MPMLFLPGWNSSRRTRVDSQVCQGNMEDTTATCKGTQPSREWCTHGATTDMKRQHQVERKLRYAQISL